MRFAFLVPFVTIFFFGLFGYSETIQTHPLIVGEELFTKVETRIETKENKATVVVFLSAACPCSNSHIPILKSLSNEFKDFKFVAIHSNADESIEDTRKYFLKSNLPFTIIQDHRALLANQFKANKTPHAFIINAAGEVIYRGGVTNSSHAPAAEKMYLADALKDVSENKKIRLSETRTLGCAIAREGEKNVL